MSFALAARAQPGYRLTLSSALRKLSALLSRALPSSAESTLLHHRHDPFGTYNARQRHGNAELALIAAELR